ncbi:complement factor B-like [Heptranchias perlo]|uniref:complement factor B-like n=1 Tax=Heptranchias perlo TaxID=212740 RepID=UPI00355A44F1
MALQLKMDFSWARLPGMDMAFILLITMRVLPAVICEEQLCSNEEVIKGGRIEWPENRVERSVMTYICPVGFRPYPVSWRYCNRDNYWSQLRNVYGETALEATCNEMTCLAPKHFEFGSFAPVENTYKVKASVTFQCFDGYQLIGSATRTCLANGHWSGTLPRCNSEDTFCPNPGIPFGARKEGKYYDVFSTVQYHCDKHILRGSSKRTCLETGQWSGVEPRCESKYSFDNVEDLAKELDVLESTVRNPDLNSRTEVNPGQKRGVNVFFVIDASRRVGNENFIKSLNFVKTFINRVSDVNGLVRFEVVAFGSYSIMITDIKENLTPKAVIERIKRVDYREYYNNTGRRTGIALELVHSSINETVKLQIENGQPVPKQVIIIITGGLYNGKPAPFIVTKKISDQLSHLPNCLDIYAIGIGEIHKQYLESLVPVKRTITEGQQYAFYLPSYHYLKEAQEKQKKNYDLQFAACGIRGKVRQRPIQRIFGGIKSKEYDWPWQVIIGFPGRDFCGGSIISKRWILSAAHCINDTVGMTSNITIWAGSIRRERQNIWQELTVEEVIIHENFSRPSEMNNDIALLKVKDPIIFSAHVRPVCLPCTKKSAQLLFSIVDNWDEVCHYEDDVLTSHGGRNQKVLSGYVSGWGIVNRRSSILSLDLHHAQVYIQYRMTCDSPYPLTETMFCAKGDETDSCRGDSGGPLVMQRNHRWIQVGIISFGRKAVCGENVMGFYSSVPKLMSWIKERVTDLEYE